MNALMGIFIVAGHIFNDKAQDVIRAARVSPISMRGVLLSKLIAYLPGSILTSLIICIPIMKAQANYPLLIVILLSASFFAGSIGLLISSFFDNMKSSFGLMMIILVILMLPVLSYYMPTFSPGWVKLIPSHYILLSVKEVISTGVSYSYPLITSAVLIAAGLPLIEISAFRYKKVL